MISVSCDDDLENFKEEKDNLGAEGLKLYVFSSAEEASATLLPNQSVAYSKEFNPSQGAGKPINMPIENFQSVDQPPPLRSRPSVENADYITPTGRTEKQGSVYVASRVGGQRNDFNKQPSLVQMDDSG